MIRGIHIPVRDDPNISLYSPRTAPWWVVVQDAVGYNRTVLLLSTHTSMIVCEADGVKTPIRFEYNTLRTPAAAKEYSY